MPFDWITYKFWKRISKSNVMQISLQNSNQSWKNKSVYANKIITTQIIRKSILKQYKTCIIKIFYWIHFLSLRKMLLVQLKIPNRKNARRPDELNGAPDGIIRELWINRKVKWHHHHVWRMATSSLFAKSHHKLEHSSESRRTVGDLMTGQPALLQSVYALANCVTVGTIGAPVHGQYTSSTCSLATVTSTRETAEIFRACNWSTTLMGCHLGFIPRSALL